MYCGRFWFETCFSAVPYFLPTSLREYTLFEMAYRLYTLAEVESRTDRALMVLHNKVYDVIEWLADRPELASAFKGGGDASHIIDNAVFSPIANLWKRNFLVGKLVPDDRFIYTDEKRGVITRIYLEYTLEEHKELPVRRHVQNLATQSEVGTFELEVRTSSGVVLGMREETLDKVMDADFPLEIKIFPNARPASSSSST